MQKATGTVVDQDRLAANIAAQCPGMSNGDALNLLQVVIRSIAAEVRASGDATIGGLGRFRVVRKPVRRCYVPSTKQFMDVPAHTVLKIVPSRHFMNRCIDAEM